MCRRCAGSLHNATKGMVVCHRATTPRELDAIARLRYEVHVREHNVPLDEADHARQRLWYPDDDLSTTLHFYAGSADEMLGCLRIRLWGPGQVPEDMRAFYSMDRLPGLDALTVCDVTKMVVVPKLRGTTAMAALSGYSIHETVRAYGNPLMFACCAPGLRLTRHGVVERELFLVMGGEFAAFRGDQELRRMRRGEVFGEIALLSHGGQRRAEVRAITAGRVLVLRRKLLPELSKSEPRVAFGIYRALTQELLGKLMEEPPAARAVEDLRQRAEGALRAE